MFFSRTWQDKLIVCLRAHPEITRIRFSVPEDDRWWVVTINWVRRIFGLRPWIANDVRERCAQSMYMLITDPQPMVAEEDNEPF